MFIGFLIHCSPTSNCTTIMVCVNVEIKFEEILIRRKTKQHENVNVSRTKPDFLMKYRNS